MAADTVVLVHGLWMRGRSWARWQERYAARGLKVLAPDWPGLDSEAGIAALTIDGVAAHFEALVRELPSPPILMGHSFGGALVQVLLNRGLGAAGVVIDSAPTRGVLRTPLSTVRATFPVLKSPGNRKRAVPLTLKQFRYAFCNAQTEEWTKELYEVQHVAAPGRFLFDGATQNFAANAATRVDYAKAGRAPLLFIAGGKDHIVPASVNRANFKLYTAGVVALHEFPERDHSTCASPGWEAVADYALDWAQQ